LWGVEMSSDISKGRQGKPTSMKSAFIENGFVFKTIRPANNAHLIGRYDTAVGTASASLARHQRKYLNLHILQQLARMLLRQPQRLGGCISVISLIFFLPPRLPSSLP